MKIAIYPGTFDPITNGHLDVIERSSSLFDKVIVAVLEKSDNKELVFNTKQRLNLVHQSIAQYSNVETEVFNELLVEYAKSKNAISVIRGLRAISDFEYEFQMTLMNRSLDEHVSTIFLMPHQKYIHISSSLVKEVAELGGNVNLYVPEHVNSALKKKYH